MTETNSGLELGIGTDVRSKNLVPFVPTWDAPFPQAVLTEVKAMPRELKDKSAIRQIIQFTFKDAANVRTHTHTEWELDPTDTNFATKFEGLQSRIKHIYEEFQKFPEGGIKSAKTFEGLFKNIETAFNTNGKEGTPIYKGIPVWLKIVYILAYPNVALGFPLSPNFIERIQQGKGTTLAINKKYETLDQPVGKGKKNNPLGNDSPGFGAAPDDFPDFKG